MNDEQKSGTPFDSMAEVFRHRAASEPDRWCYSFLRDGEDDEERVTYAEVHARASAVAGLIERHTAPGDRVLLLFPPGLDFIYAFVGCLYAGVVAVPMAAPHPLRLARALPRLHAVIEDCAAALALTSSALARAAAAMETPPLRWLSTEDIEGPHASHSGRPAGDLAFLQYTSGATGEPKAVMVSHRNLLANEAMIARAFGSTRESLGVGWLPFHHDMGLIGNVLHPPFAGYPVVLLPPLSVLQQPRRWLRAISRHGATVSGGPDFAYDLCTRRVVGGDASDLDLSRSSIAFSGAETVRPGTLDRFATAFGASGFRRSSFYACYGLAEATLIVTGGDREREPVVRTGSAQIPRVGCGAALLDAEVCIVDPATRRPSAAGEIWVRGPNVARGYWNRPEESEATFRTTTADGQGPWLRTGDLGWMDDGQLFIDGRLKDLLIVRGQNHHPQDIELTVERASPAVQPASVVAFALETESGEELAVAAEIDAHTAEPYPEIAAVVRSAVVEAHGVVPAALALLPRGALARTTSGKLRRSTTAAAFREGSLPVLAVFRARSG